MSASGVESLLQGAAAADPHSDQVEANRSCDEKLDAARKGNAALFGTRHGRAQ